MDDIGQPARFAKFPLVPFSPVVPGGTIHATLRFERERNLIVTFDLHIPDSRLVWPKESANPQRRDELWKSTCCEIFIAAHGDPSYVEINLSPAGDWNIYRFSDERKGMAPVKNARVEVRSSSKEFEKRLVAQMDCPEIHERMKTRNVVGITAVLDLQAGQQEFWALQHSGKKPDFHRRVDWLKSLEAK